ncbi:MAG: hypothetical protein NTY34_03235 [Candidatus Omnitrophica bacterium]|nr:hypothetical protein [Candidatus Omnitrophota bacterium]
MINSRIRKSRKPDKNMELFVVDRRPDRAYNLTLRGIPSQDGAKNGNRVMKI